jgi:hypothetical protein
VKVKRKNISVNDIINFFLFFILTSSYKGLLHLVIFISINSVDLTLLLFPNGH